MAKFVFNSITVCFLFLVSSAPSLAADFRWVVYNNTNLNLKISKFGAQVQNKAVPYKYFWGADECVWIDRSNAAKKTLKPTKQRGFDCSDPQVGAIRPKRKFRVEVECPNGSKKTIYFPRDGGYFPKGYRANSDVHYQLVLESYDC